MNKEKIYEHIVVQLNDKIIESSSYLNDLIDSRNSDTKSSAGDKYETSRSMVQQEIDRAEERISKLKIQLNEVENVRKIDQVGVCQPGSIVVLENQYFLLGVALGKVEIQGQMLFCISMASPLGQILRGKKENEQIDFRGKVQKIQKVI